MEVLIPSLQEPNLAPQGQHVLAANVMYVPHDLKSSWTPEHRAELLDTVLCELTRYASGIQDLVLASELLAPQDLATQYRAANGHRHHCELAIDQLLMMRPTYQAAQYATPISGLYLCAAADGPRWSCRLETFRHWSFPLCRRHARGVSHGIYRRLELRAID